MAQPELQTFGKYQILELVATGGMAEIYKARLEGIGGFQRTFAIKRILPNLSQNSEYIAMLVDEAKVAGLLSHANIVQILDLGQVDGIWYIAMEYVHGRDLGEVLRRVRGKALVLPVPHAVFVVIELLKGLEYAHQRQVMRGGKPVALNIIHRDVSPTNILLSFQGEVKLTDFGIARASLKAMETISGVVKGRFDYMSPEQAAGARDLDQRSALFTVGVVLYEMLTGVHPFRAETEIGTIERIRDGQYVPVCQRNPEVPPALEAILQRALQRDREQRYPNATAFKEALDRFFHDSGFIFTHATLSAYVKGLFPEAVGKVNTGTPAPKRVRQRRGDETEDVELEPVETVEVSAKQLERALSQGGTGPSVPRAPAMGSARPAQPRSAEGRSGPVAVSPKGVSLPPGSPRRPSMPPSPAPRPTPPTAGSRAPEPAARPSPLMSIPGFADDTGVRRAAEWEDDAATAIRPNAFQDEQETIIRRSPIEAPAPAPPPPTPGSGERTGDVRTGDARTDGRGVNRRKATRGRGIGWFGGLLVVLALFTGAALGAGGFALVGVAAGWGTAAGGPSTLRVVAPPGTAVLLDGVAIGNEVPVPVSTGERHEVEIQLQGGQKVKEDLEIGPGENVVVVVPPPARGAAGD